MALYSGVTGKVSVKKGTSTSVDILHISGWDVNLEKEILKGAYFGQDYKDGVAGVKDWNASFNGDADFASTSGQKDLVDAFEDGTALECSFYLDDNTYLVGNALVKSLAFKDAADGKASLSIALEGISGATLTVPTT